ncbi:MAG: response regulator, partial [Solirubrobacteraceae bacterium]
MTAEPHPPSAIVVDAVPDRRARTCEVLRRAGFEVVEVESASDAAPLARGRDLAVIVVDPPDLDGVDLIERLRAQRATAGVSILARSPTSPGVTEAPPPAAGAVRALDAGADA